MKKFITLFVILFSTILLTAQTRYWVASATANWSSNNWSSTSGGAPDGSGPPTSAQNARFNANGLGNCNINVPNPSISDLVLNGYTGVLNLNGRRLTVTNYASLYTGTINGAANDSLVINGTGDVYFRGTTFGVIVNSNSDNLYLGGSTFNRRVTLKKNGNGSNNGAGGNTFNAKASIVLNGSGYLMTASSNPDIFNGDLFLKNTGTNYIYLARIAAGTQFNGNVIINSTSSSQGFLIGYNGGTSTMAAGKQFKIGSSGFTDGNLYIYNCTQLGTAAQNLTLSGNATLSIDNCIWNGPVNFSSPSIYTYRTKYKGVTTLSKTGTGSNASNGHNFFAAATTLNNSGTGYFLMAQTNPDTFNLGLTMNNTGTNNLYISYSSVGNLINGNLTINNSANYVYVNGTNSPTTVINGNVSLTNNGSISNSNIYFGNLGSLVLNGNLTALNNGTGPNSDIYFANGSASNLILNGNVTVINSGNTNSNNIYLGQYGNITFNGDLSIINSSSANNSYIHANRYGNNLYNGNIQMQVTNANADGIEFGDQGGTGILANGKTITIGSGGFIGGNLYFRNFTKLGTGAVSLVTSGPTAFYSYESKWGGNATFTAATVISRNTLYSGITNLIKYGASNDASPGGNKFMGLTTITNSGSGYLRFANNDPDTFNTDLTLFSTASNVISLARNANNNIFNGNITLNSNASSNGIYFGYGGGTSTLAATKSIYNGAGGFSSGSLYIYNLTQLGSAPINLTLTGNSATFIQNSKFGGDVSIITPRITTFNSVYNGNTILTKTNSGTDYSNGLNRFKGNVNLTNTGNGYFSMGNTNPDTFDINLTMVNSGNNNMYIANNSLNNYIGGNLIATNNSATNNGYLNIANTSNSSINIVGNVTLTNSGAAPTNYLYFGDGGDITVGGNLTATNLTSGNNGDFRMANNASSEVIINGTATFLNDGNGNNSDFYIANQGKITFNGDVKMTNASSANNSDIYVTNNAVSSAIFNGNIIVESTHANSDGVRFNLGYTELAATKTITIGTAGFIGGDLYFNNFHQLGNTPQTLLPTGNTRFTNYYSDWGGNVNFRGDALYSRDTHYRGTAKLEKTGSSSDQSQGGNVFYGNTEITNSGSGYLLWSNGNTDTFKLDLSLINSGSSYIYLFYNSSDNYIGGNFTVNQTTSGGYNAVSIGNYSSTATIEGNVILNNLSTADNANIFFPNTGNFISNGNLTINNSPTGLSGHVYIADGNTSSLSIAGTTIATNSGGNNTRRIYLGDGGDVTFGNDLFIYNNSSAINSQVYCNYNINSTNLYNGNIVLESTHANSDGIYFGNGDGQGTLAATKTITIGTNGFIAGDLQFRNFTQIGPTAQTLQPTGTSFISQYNSSWGGNTVFSAPRYITYRTHYTGTSYIEKNGDFNDISSGGNVFDQNTTLVNKGSGYLLMGNGEADTFRLNLSMSNQGTYNMYLANNSFGNFIGGDLNVTNSGSGNNYFYISNSSSTSLDILGNVVATNSGTGTGSYLYLADDGDVSVGGNLTVNNTSSASGSANTYTANNNNSSILVNGNVAINNTGTSPNMYSYLGTSGDFTIGGDVNIVNDNSVNNAQVSVANSSNSIGSIAGKTTVINKGAGNLRQVYLGNNGSIDFNDDLSISNQSSANSSQIYCNYNNSSTNNYLGNIVLENTHANGDGVLFGGNNGQATLAATKTITIGTNGFVAGDLYLRNFTQIGPTAQTLQPTGTTSLTQYNSDWGGNTIFTSPRLFTHGTHYTGTAYLAKNGLYNDQSYGGNVFDDYTSITNSGDGYLLLGNGNPDTFRVDLDMVNSGSYNMYLGYNSTGNYIGGNLDFTNSANGNSNCYFSSTSNSSINIVGNVDILNSGVGVNSCYTYFGLDGDMDVGGYLNLNNSTSGVNGSITVASGSNSLVNVAGNVKAEDFSTSTSSSIYLAISGDMNINGNLDFTNDNTANSVTHYIASTNISTVNISGQTNIINKGAGAIKDFFIGNQGDVNFAGNLNISNQASATNSRVFLNYNNNSNNTYAGNIVIENTHPNGDGVLFGNNNGQGTLAATKTITIGSNGFVAGDLYLRNFTQIGATPQTLQPTGTTSLTQYNSDWGGNTVFTSPRIFTYGTHYAGTAYLEKNGAFNDASAGANKFDQKTDLVNSGSGYFLMGNGNPDTFRLNLDVLNSGTNHFYLAHNGVGNFVGGDLKMTNTGSGSSANLYLLSYTSSTLNVLGKMQVNNTGSANSNIVYLCDAGTLNIGSDVTMINNSTGTNGSIYLSDNASSLVSIGGNTIADNIGTGDNQYLYLGYVGNVNYGGNLAIRNTNAAITGVVVLGNGTSSSNTIPGNTTVLNTGAGVNKQVYLGNNGDITFNGKIDIVNSSSATNAQVFLNHGTPSANIYNDDITIEQTNPIADGVYFGNGGGQGTLANGKVVKIGTNGFVDGDLTFRNFIQLGATPQTLHPTGSSYIDQIGSSWNGNVDFKAARFTTRNTTYNGTALLEKTNAINDYSYGGNIFNGVTTIKNSGTGYLLLAGSNPDDYNDDVTYISTNTGPFYPNYNAISTYAGDINCDFNKVITFGNGGSAEMIMDGTTAQSINNLNASPELQIRNLKLNNTVDEVTLNMPITVFNRLDMTRGNIISSPTNLITLTDNTPVINASNNSYVRGPIEKIGNDAFIFPVGDSGMYRPIAISAPSSGSARFRATYFEQNPHPTYTWNALEAGLNNVSTREYWILDRISSTNNVNVTLSWDTNSGGVGSMPDLRVARWDGTKWANHGNGGTTGTNTKGTVISSAAVTNFSPFTLASTSIVNPLPIELLSFDATATEDVVLLNWSTATEINNDFFTVERSYNGKDFTEVAIVKGAGNSLEKLNYALTDYYPLEGVSYYRLKQTDFNGDFSYSDLRAVEFNKGLLKGFKVYPVPVTDNEFTVEFKTEAYLKVAFVVTDLFGRIIYQNEINNRNHENKFLVRPSIEMPSGTYILNVIGEGKNLGQQKIIVNR